MFVREKHFPLPAMESIFHPTGQSLGELTYPGFSDCDTQSTQISQFFGNPRGYL
jgi:hypothetical protein